ncbi:DUF1540 domain-containing protein, partial [Streptomyces incanus]
MTDAVRSGSARRPTGTAPRSAQVRWPPMVPAATLDQMGHAHVSRLSFARGQAGETHCCEETAVMEMPAVHECVAEDCAYNRDRACHALAITVGDTAGVVVRHAHCDTFVSSP